jgi:two-component system, NarL family, sensor kinase
VAAMRAATLDELALEPLLQRLVSEFAESTGLRVQLEIAVRENASLAPQLTQALYRAVQEGLTNVQRHAHATEVVVTLRSTVDSVALEIHDNGIGTSATSNGHDSVSSGYGLIGLRERVALLDVQLAFEPSPAGGSCLSITLPIHASEHLSV